MWECWQHGSQFDEELVQRIPRPSGGPEALWRKQLCAQGTQSVAKHVPDLYSEHVQFGTRGWPKSSQREQLRQQPGPTHWLAFGYRHGSAGSTVHQGPQSAVVAEHAMPRLAVQV